MMFPPSDPVLPDTGNIINLLGPQKPFFLKDIQGVSVRVDYEWICQEILKRLKYPDVEDVIRILRELDAEQDKR